MEQNEEKVKILREWISKQPHLPHKNHTNLLRRFLHCSNDSIELAKNWIDLFYTLRSQLPEIFSNRDPNSPQIQETFENIQFLPLPNLTKENYQMFIYRLMTSDVDKYDFVAGSKGFSIVADVRMVVNSVIAEGEVPIFDMNYFSIRHLAKMPFSILRKMALYSQEAHPIKLKQIHFVNAPPFFDKFLTILKPIVKSDILKMIHFHLPNSETLFNYVPRNLLPEEYGGTIGKCDDIKEKWAKLVIEWRDYLMDEDYWRVDESKRPASNDGINACKHFGIQGSFKSLSID